MAFSSLTACSFALAITLSGAASSLLHQSSRTHLRAKSFAGLRFSPQDPAARTLLALDTNHDGRIDPPEIAVFAKAQGLDAEAATEEFSSIDVDGNGVLDSSELQQALGSSPPASLAAAKQTQPVAELVTNDVGSQETSQVAAPVEAAMPGGYDMLSDKLAANIATASDSPSMISADARTSVRQAAQKVAENLALEEKEEMKARELERKAAEDRSNAASLTKSTLQDALSVGSKAAHAKANEMMAKIAKLEDDAQKAEVRRAALMAKSKLEIEQGSELMSVADKALKQAPEPQMHQTL